MIIVNDRDKIHWRELMTVQDLLDELGYDFVLLTVIVNGKFIPEDEYTETTIPDDSDVKALHLHHGG